MNNLSIHKKIELIVSWLNKIMNDTKTKGFVFGISGGIDSAIISYIMSKYFFDHSIGFILNIENNINDKEDALLIAESSKVKYEIINVENIFKEFKKIAPNDKKILGNIKSRIRMTTLYSFAQKNNMLVLGTSNANEFYTGYFTKYGDSGADILPLVNLLKKDIRLAASFLNIPKKIISKPPTAGLYDDQTDEQELNISYEEIDRFLLKQKISKDKKNILNELHKNSKHKRNFPYSILKKGKIL